MGQTEVIERLITPTLRGEGYALVRVRLSGARRTTLQVMAERLDGEAMTVDDCANISRVLSALLDVEDPVSGSYDLEVSSPGLDRPLIKKEDFTRYAGFEVEVRTNALLSGTRRFCGRLVGVMGTTVGVDLNDSGGVIQIPFVEICEAKLVMAEDLVAVPRKRDR